MSDLISRQAAIEALDSHCDAICKYSKKQRFVMCGACPLGSAFDVLDDLPPAQQWIPAFNPPKENKSYIVTTSKENVTVASYNTDLGWEFCNIIAWMPLPEPYKEEKGDS